MVIEPAGRESVPCQVPDMSCASKEEDSVSHVSNIATAAILVLNVVVLIL